MLIKPAESSQAQGGTCGSGGNALLSWVEGFIAQEKGTTMNATLLRQLALCVVLGMLLAWPAHGEVNVSLTITGNIDEITAIVQQLRTMGYGGGFDANDPLKLRVHSTHNVQEESVAPAPPPPAPQGAPQAPPAPPAQPAPPPPPPPEPKPVLALNNPVLSPASINPGQAVLVTVEVIDLQNAIDTLAATFGATKATVDLHDNGTNGDVAVGDGIWSARLTVPAEAAPGPYEVNIAAYNANGAPIMTLTKDQRIVPLNAKAHSPWRSEISGFRLWRRPHPRFLVLGATVSG